MESQNVIHLGKNPTFHSRSLHMLNIIGYMMLWMLSYWSCDEDREDVIHLGKNPTFYSRS